MDVFYQLYGQTFVWDGRKAIENRAKHGIQFEDACEAFFDDLSTYVDASVRGEQRTALLGMNAEGLMYVVHIVRETETIRLISARWATRQDRRKYEDG